MAISIIFPALASVEHFGNGCVFVNLTDAYGDKFRVQVRPEEADGIASVLRPADASRVAWEHPAPDGTGALTADPAYGPEGVPMCDLWPLKPGSAVEVVVADAYNYWPLGHQSVADDSGCIRGIVGGRWLARKGDWHPDSSPLRLRIISGGRAV